MLEKCDFQEIVFYSFDILKIVFQGYHDFREIVIVGNMLISRKSCFDGTP